MKDIVTNYRITKEYDRILVTYLTSINEAEVRVIKTAIYRVNGKHIEEKIKDILLYACLDNQNSENLGITPMSLKEIEDKIEEVLEED